jgi:hypothetical protein
MSSRVSLALFATLSLGGCTVYGTDLRSVATVGPETARVSTCPGIPELFYMPASGARLCFSAHGVAVEVEARNAEPLVLAIGPLVPLFPWWPDRSSPGPLTIDLGFKADDAYAFRPWDASVQTSEGDTIGVSRVFTNAREDKRVHTVEVDRHDSGARLLPARFSLTFGRPVPPEQAFSLTLHLVGRDGTDVQLPTINFRAGKVSFLGTVP